MKNFEKYKTAEERTEAFWKYYAGPMLPYDTLLAFAGWLDLEAEEEKPLPCPFCGGTIQVINDTQAISESARWLVNCYCCPYEYGAETKEKLIAAHNRVAKGGAGREGKGGER